MADKNVQIKNVAGEKLFPKTKASLVEAGDGQNLGTVEPGAQVNKIEQIKVNGQVVAPKAKVIELNIPSQAEYTIAKEDSPEEGFAATYHLKKAGQNAGVAINIPKDLVVQSGSVKTVEQENQPVQGYKVGEKYIDLLLANGNNQHVYILVNDLVDVYTAGTGVKIAGRAISVDEAAVALKSWVESTFAKKGNTIGAYGITDAYNKGEIDNKLGGKADKSALEGKANKATTLSGYGITDGLTFEEIQ